LPPDIFDARRVAILGASTDPTKLGHRPLHYLKHHGFAGEVFPINPRGGEVLGWSCYPSLASVGGQVDAALISLSARMVPGALEECAEQGVRLAVVLTAGVDPSLRAPEGMWVLGPNSMGFLNAERRLGAVWSASLFLDSFRAGSVGLISQSGSLGGSLLNRLHDKGAGFSYAFWTGNESFVDTCHLLEFLLRDKRTRVVAVLAEGFRRPRKLLELAEVGLELGKPIVVLKLAQQPAASAMTVAHTGILAGAARSWHAAFRQSGLVEATGLDDVVDKAALFERVEPPAGEALAVVSSSGGISLMATDLCQELGIELAPLAEETKRDLKALVPPYAPEPDNPLDITAGLPESTLFACLARLAEDPGVDLLLNAPSMLGDTERMRVRAEGLIGARDQVSKPIVSCWTAGSLADAGLVLSAEAQLPYYTSLERCLGGIKSLFEYGRWRRERGSIERLVEPGRAAEARAALEAAQAEGQRVVVEREALPLLAAYGLPTVEIVFAGTADAAVAAAERLGGIVVLKADAPNLAHKSRVGGVLTGLRGEAAVRDAFERIRAAVPELRGVLVQPQAAEGVEAVLGIAQDAQLGPQVLLGLGGIYAEALAQVAVRLAPLRPRDADELIDETPLRALPGREHLRQAILRLGQLAADCADLIAECDLNPVRLYPDGVLALDGLIVLRTDDP
jgi:acetyltransferase